MNKNIKKMVAVSAAVLFAVTPVAFAATLADYPSPFVADGMFEGKLVLGEKAVSIDTIGAIDIMTSLQRASSSSAGSSSSTVVSTSGKVEDVLLNTNLGASTAFGDSVDDTDLPFLADSVVTFDIDGESEDYDYHEEVRLNTSVSKPATVETGLTNSETDDEFEDKVFISLGPDSIGYYYVFDEDLTSDLFIANASSDDPVELEFLGQNLKITDADADSITVQVGNEYFMTVGDTVTVNGKTVKLVNVASSGDTAVVEVDGVRETVTGTKSVNGLRIKVEDTFTSDTLSERSANLIVGDQATKTYDNNDEYIGEPDDDPAWTWDLAGLGGATPVLGVTWELTLEDVDPSTDNTKYTHPIYEGESIEFPNGFAEIKFDSLNQDEYVTYDFTDATKDVVGTSSTEDVIRGKVTGLSNSGFIVNGQKSEEVYLYRPPLNTTISVFYKSTSNSDAVFGWNRTTGQTLFQLDYGKSLVDADGAFVATDVDDIDGNITFDFDGSNTDDVIMNLESASGAFTYVGDDDEDTDTGLAYESTSISNWEENTRTASGVRIWDPDSTWQKSSGALKFDLPKDVEDFRANIVIQGKGGQTSSGSTGGAVMVNPIAVGAAIFDSDATLGSKPYIVVGGPCANTVAAALMGNPENCAEGFAEGKAKIKLFSSQNALLVAGGSGSDTQGAARVLANYRDYSDKMTGTELEVITSNMNNLVVNKVQ